MFPRDIVSAETIKVSNPIEAGTITQSIFPSESIRNRWSQVYEAYHKHFLEQFNIYCLIHEDRKREAQLMLDLLKEKGFKDNFFENKESIFSLIIELFINRQS